MLRKALLLRGVVLLATPLVGSTIAIGPAILGAVLVLALLAERYVYKPIRDVPPGPGWDKTAERFADLKSGRSVVVYFNSRTGQRLYVAEGPAEHES
jgi:hypothetical protein